MTTAERIAAIDAEAAELRRIVNAPRRLATLMSQRRDLELRAERAERLEAARAVDPDYDQRLEDARAAVVAAQAEADKHEARRRADWQDGGSKVKFRDGDTEVLVIGSGVMTGGAPQDVFPRFLPAPSLAHRIAIEKLDLAKSFVKRLERFPSALAEGGDAPAGESASDRIKNAPKVPFGARIRSRLRNPAYDARYAEAMGEDAESTPAKSA